MLFVFQAGFVELALHERLVNLGARSLQLQEVSVGTRSVGAMVATGYVGGDHLLDAS